MRVGIMTALDQEIAVFLRHVEGFQRTEAMRRTYWFGPLGKHEVALTKSGVGKVRAAACAQFLIDRYAIEALIFAGVAGAINPQLRVGDIVVSRRATQHDYDRADEAILSRAFSRWQQADPRLVEIAYGAATDLLGPSRVILGSVLTGDQPVTKPEKKAWLWEKFQGDCVEMEGAAVGQVCAMNGVPFVLIRAISDLADGGALTDFLKNVHAVAGTSAQIVLETIARLA